jgi:hypothetical protein
MRFRIGNLAPELSAKDTKKNGPPQKIGFMNPAKRAEPRRASNPVLRRPREGAWARVAQSVWLLGAVWDLFRFRNSQVLFITAISKRGYTAAISQPGPVVLSPSHQVNPTSIAPRRIRHEVFK